MCSDDFFPHGLHGCKIRFAISLARQLWQAALATLETSAATDHVAYQVYSDIRTRRGSSLFHVVGHVNT